MMNWNDRSKSNRVLVLVSLACISVGFTGCQVQVAGQTLPSAYYHLDDVQHFPTGSENKLARETAALKAARAESRVNR